MPQHFTHKKLPVGGEQYLIIIGAGKSQVPYIQAAQRLGFHAVAMDQNENAPGVNIADSFYPVSTHDFNEINQICTQLHDHKKIAGILTSSSFPEPLKIVARLCERFTLPGYSVDTVEKVSDKRRMQISFKTACIPIPDSITTNNLSDAKKFWQKSSGTCVIKPGKETCGSAGVNKIISISELTRYFHNTANLSADKSVLIEEFIEGKEYSIDGFVTNGKPHIMSVSQKFNGGANNSFVMTGFATLTDNGNRHTGSTTIKHIKQTAADAVTALNITNSFFSVDLIARTTTEIVVIEAGILLDAKIDRLLDFAGVNIYELRCRIAAGMELSISLPTHNNAFALRFFFAPQKGILSLNKNQKTNACSGKNLLVEWERQEGDEVGIPSSIADTLGWIITKGKDTDDAWHNASMYHIPFGII